ncbi:hypothetical protein JL721_4088 [Aureococcus anophagefferens]|nr:hypothetical protein JL721_4088 [Aureococcus anophagefferens]
MIATQTTAEACALAVLGLSGSGDAGAAHSAAVLGAAELRFGFNDAGTLTFGTMTIKNPGDLAARVVEGDTMLHVAVRSSLQDVCGALLAPDARAPLGVRNARGETAFEVAVAGDAPAETKEDAEADADLASAFALSLEDAAPAEESFFGGLLPSWATRDADLDAAVERSLAPEADEHLDAALAASLAQEGGAAQRRSGEALRRAIAASVTQRIRGGEPSRCSGRAPAEPRQAPGPPPGAPAPASRRSIEAIEDELRAATARCLAGDPTAEADLERLDAALRAHPDFAVRRASEKARWDRDERAANRAALKATRGLVPPDILRSTAAKAHIADLRGATRSRGVGVVELGPSGAARDFDNDGDGAKAAWREQVRAKLVDAVDREKRGALAAGEKRRGLRCAAGPFFDTDSADDWTPDAADPFAKGGAACPARGGGARGAVGGAPEEG